MILKGIITQHTTDEVFVTITENPTLAQVDISIDPQDASRLIITTDNEIFDSGKPAKGYIINKGDDKYFVVAIDRKKLEVKMWDKNGTETSNILNNAEFEV